MQVDTVAPDVVINNPAPGSPGSSGLVTDTNVTVDGLVLDVPDTILLEGQIDDGIFFEVTFDPAGNYSFDTTFTLDGSDNGLHTVRVRATDLGRERDRPDRNDLHPRRRRDDHRRRSFPHHPRKPPRKPRP